MRGRGLVCAAVVVILNTPDPAACAAVIYQEGFDGAASSGLNGRIPAVRTGADGGSATAAWSAFDPVFKADGSVGGKQHDATAVLPFTPQPGRVYSLRADVDTTTGESFADWIGLGFEQANFPNTSFIAFQNAASGWMLLRPVRGAGLGQTFLGARPDYPTWGRADHDVGPGRLTEEVVLDTTAPAWTVQWRVDGVSVRGPVAFTTNPEIHFVGVSRLNLAGGTVDNFSLTSVPEPSALTSVLAGASAVAMRRRRAGQK